MLQTLGPLMLFTQLNDYTMPYFMADKKRTTKKKKKPGKQIKQQKMRTGLGTTHTICHRVRNGVRNYTDIHVLKERK